MQKMRSAEDVASKICIGVNWCKLFLALNLDVENLRLFFGTSGLVGMMSYDDRHMFQADMRHEDLQRLTLKGAILRAKGFGRCSWISIQHS